MTRSVGVEGNFLGYFYMEGWEHVRSGRRRAAYCTIVGQSAKRSERRSHSQQCMSHLRWAVQRLPFSCVYYRSAGDVYAKMAYGRTRFSI